MYYIIDIGGLRKILPVLTDLVDWKRLGLELGLLHSTLLKIDTEQRGMVDDCMLEMISSWLNWRDEVKLCGMPSWKRLIDALEKIGENAIASQIIKSEPWNE